jgi:hypothetical protein
MKRVHGMLQSIVVFVALAFGTAQASTSSSEITDMWWNPGESGWGVNVILQNDVAFLTFFVYDTMGIPIWYTSDAHLVATGETVWTGKLYATNGPWFGGPFAAGNVKVRQAGTATFTVTALNQAVLTYSVDGVTVTKTLERQTWTNEDYTGEYLGSYSVTNTNCTVATLNGAEDVLGALSVTQNGAAASMTLTSGGTTCTYSGTYVQTGKLGEVDGNFACTNGVQGSFALGELTPTISGFTGRIVGQNQYCQFSGYFGGVRRAP